MQAIDIIVGLPMPLLARPVRAGRPSPVEDFIEEEIDLQRLLIEDRATMEQAVTAHAARLGEKLRREGLGSDHVTVFDTARANTTAAAGRAPSAGRIVRRVVVEVTRRQENVERGQPATAAACPDCRRIETDQKH